MINAASPVHELLFKAVRESNLRRRGQHQMRIVLGGPPDDWGKIKTRSDLTPFLQGRDSLYARIVSQEVLARKRRALLRRSCRTSSDWPPSKRRYLRKASVSGLFSSIFDAACFG